MTVTLQVPRWHSLYTPSHVLHTNNYLKGTWRTMLSDLPVNEGKLSRSDGRQLHFTFQELVETFPLSYLTMTKE